MAGQQHFVTILPGHTDPQIGIERPTLVPSGYLILVHGHTDLLTLEPIRERGAIDSLTRHFAEQV